LAARRGGGDPQDRGLLDGVVGTADVRVPSREEALPSAYISNVCVDVDSRRLGVASMLLDKCFEVAAAWGLEEVPWRLLSQSRITLTCPLTRCAYSVHIR